MVKVNLNLLVIHCLMKIYLNQISQTHFGFNTVLLFFLKIVRHFLLKHLLKKIKLWWLLAYSIRTKVVIERSLPCEHSKHTIICFLYVLIFLKNNAIVC